MEEEKDKTEKQGQISRREFLKDAGLIVGGATVGSMAILSACGKTETETSTKTVTNTVTSTSTVTVTSTTPSTASNINTIDITVNGHKYLGIKVKPEWTLQHLLHEELGWTDVKDMCVGYGACGACAVIL